VPSSFLFPHRALFLWKKEKGPRQAGMLDQCANLFLYENFLSKEVSYTTKAWSIYVAKGLKTILEDFKGVVMEKKDVSVIGCLNCGGCDLNPVPGGVYACYTQVGVSPLGGYALCNKCGYYGIPLVFKSEKERMICNDGSLQIFAAELQMRYEKLKERR
jgi:hypothetical protein